MRDEFQAVVVIDHEIHPVLHGLSAWLCRGIDQEDQKKTGEETYLRSTDTAESFLPCAVQCAYGGLACHVVRCCTASGLESLSLGSLPGGKTCMYQLGGL